MTLEPDAQIAIFLNQLPTSFVGFGKIIRHWDVGVIEFKIGDALSGKACLNFSPIPESEKYFAVVTEVHQLACRRCLAEIQS